jgi:hypothetical protein
MTILTMNRKKPSDLRSQVVGGRALSLVGGRLNVASQLCTPLGIWGAFVCATWRNRI